MSLNFTEKTVIYTLHGDTTLALNLSVFVGSDALILAAIARLTSGDLYTTPTSRV